MSSSAPDDDALRRQFYGARDIRSLYPRVTENHLRYLEKWGLIRQAAHTTTERFYAFTDVSTIKQLAAELDRDVPLDVAFRTLRQLRSADVQLTVIKGGGHRLSESHEIETILRTVSGLLEPAA